MILRQFAMIASLAVAVVLHGCSNREVAASMEKDAGPLLAPGYSDFRIDRENVDVGIVVFSYRPQSVLKGAETVSRVKAQLRATYPCYSVQQESSDALYVRCADRSRRLMMAEEFHLAFDASRGRLFVLWLRDEPADPQIHKEFIAALDDARRQ